MFCMGEAVPEPCVGETVQELGIFSLVKLCAMSPSDTVNVWCDGGLHLDMDVDVVVDAVDCGGSIPLLSTLADLTIVADDEMSPLQSKLLGGALAARGGALRYARRASCVR